MHVKILNGQIEKFPYGPGDLIRDNPNVSFPDTMPESLLEEWGVFFVTELPMPTIDARTQRIEQQTVPTLTANGWQVGWNIIQNTAEEIMAYDARVAEFVKSERDKKLAETDWMALSDTTLTPEWASYRQALRDIPQQPDFPYNIVWPVKP